MNKANRLLLATLASLLVLISCLLYLQRIEGQGAGMLAVENDVQTIFREEAPTPVAPEPDDIYVQPGVLSSPSPAATISGTPDTKPELPENAPAAKDSIAKPNDTVPQTPTPTPAPTTAPTPTPSPQITPEGPQEGFVYLKAAFPEAKFDVRYATTHNFTGKVVEGYHSDNISLSAKAAEALKKAEKALAEKGYGLLIYDAYRPKRAVDSFIAWSNQPEDFLTKDEFYPDFEKHELFKLGYLAKRSAHSRGSTIDLTLFDKSTGEPLDMGSPYDFLGPISNHGSTLITPEQTKNRNILKDAMKAAGFKELRTEWWHYELLNEPFPETFFDFVIE